MICQQTTSQEKSIPRVIISLIRTVIGHHVHMLSVLFHLGDIQIRKLLAITRACKYLGCDNKMHHQLTIQNNLVL